MDELNSAKNGKGFRELYSVVKRKQSAEMIGYSEAFALFGGILKLSCLSG